MKCPKIRFDEAEVILLNESERADDWYSQVLKRIIERSLGSYYERDLSRELMYAQTSFDYSFQHLRKE